MLNFICLFFIVLWLVTGIISNFKNKRYVALSIFLIISPFILHSFVLKHGILLLSGIAFTSVLCYIALCKLDKFIKYKSKEARNKIIEKQVEEFAKKIKERRKEIELVNSDKIPTEEDVKLYYKMYLKKWELDHKNEWITDNIQPYTFEEWRELAKIQKYYFLVSQTCDMFIGFPPNLEMVRMNDYRKMIESEMKNEI